MTSDSILPVEAQAVPDQPVAWRFRCLGEGLDWLISEKQPRSDWFEVEPLFTRPTPAAADLTDDLAWRLAQAAYAADRNTNPEPEIRMTPSMLVAFAAAVPATPQKHPCVPITPGMAKSYAGVLDSVLPQIKDTFSRAQLRSLRDELKAPPIMLVPDARHAAAQLVAASPAAAAQQPARVDVDQLMDLIRELPYTNASEIDGEESDGTPRYYRNRRFVSLTKLERLLRECLVSPVAPVGAPTEEVSEIAEEYSAWRYGGTADSIIAMSKEIQRLRALLSAQGCELATDATKQQMFNGLTQEETDATASVMGLVHRAATPIDQDFRMRPASSEAAPSATLGLVERLRNGGQTDLADMAEKLEALTEVPRKLWLWKNFVDGRQEYWAFDNLYPIHMDNGDPQTLGEPCGYAIFKPSRDGSNGRTK